MDEWDATKCKAMYNTGGAERLAKQDPSAYAGLRQASIARGIIAPNSGFRITDAARGNRATPTPPATPAPAPPKPTIEEVCGLERTATGWSGTTAQWMEVTRRQGILNEQAKADAAKAARAKQLDEDINALKQK
jgi:hypothetical protein